jgi:hypothetical protein
VQGNSLKDDYGIAFAAALKQATFAENLDLNSAGLTDSNAIRIVNKMDRTKIKALDLGNHPNLTGRFFKTLNAVVMDGKCELQ